MLRKLGLIGFVVGLGAAACGGDDGFSDAQPETAAYQMELLGDTGEGLGTSGASQAALGSTAVPEYLGHTRTALKALNDAVAAVLKPAEAAIAASAKKTQIGDTRTFGPTDRGGATYLFTMTRITYRSFGWELKAKPQGGSDLAYQKVMGGVFERGDLPRRGRGIIGADLSKLAMVDATFHGNGQMLVGFAHVGGFKVLAFGLHEFSPDVTQFEPVDAVFGGWKGPLGEAHVRLAAYANIKDSPTEAKELVLLHARWLPGVGGRADAVAVAGDVADGHVVVANSCWDRDGSDVDGFLLVRDCADDPLGLQGCQTLRTEGQLSNCVHELGDEQLPSKDPMDSKMDPGAPETITPPTSMP